jgi:hypothetical protein
MKREIGVLTMAFASASALLSCSSMSKAVDKATSKALTSSDYSYSADQGINAISIPRGRED